jgi:hypothetical protein
MTQTAVGVLKPFKYLSEQTLSDMFGIMLKWVAYTEKDLGGYGTGIEDSGEEFSIPHDEIDPDAIFLNVELHPDTPTDRAQKITAAVTAVNGLDLSRETGLEEIGIEDPQAEMKRRASELIFEHEMNLEFQREVLQMESEIQVQTQAAISQITMAMQKQAQQDQAEPEGPVGGPEGAGFEGEISPEGVPQGLNPADGAPPPGMFAPGQNAEGAGTPVAADGGGEIV